MRAVTAVDQVGVAVDQARGDQRTARVVQHIAALQQISGQLGGFTHPQQVFAIDNRDPFFAANVLSRGIVGEHEGELWVASPLKKQHFRLRDGHCLENAAMSVQSYPVEVRDQQVWVAV